MKKLALTIILTLATIFAVNADVLYLNEGEEIVGHLKAIEKGNITFEELNKGSRNFTESEVAHILISKIRKGDEIDNIASITEPVAEGILKNLPDPSLFKDADYVTLYRLNDLEYLSDDKLVVKTREIVQILKEPGLDVANQSFYYYTEREKCDLEFAHTYSPEGQVYHVTDDAVSDESLLSGTPEFARLKKFKMALKKVDIGSIIDYCFVRELSGVDEIQPFSMSNTFGEREPVLHEELSVTFPAGMQINKVQMQWPAENPPKFLEKSQGGKKSWKWIFSDPKGFIPEQNMLPRSRIFPRVVLYQPYDWAKISSKLAAAYDEAKPSDKLLADFIARAKLTDNMTSFQKACKIYESINRDIRDVGMGIPQMGSFKPVPIDVTLQKKYGNTQSNLALLHFALKKIGIKSYPGFCSDRRELVTAKDHSTLALVDSTLLKIIIDDQPVYTDGGSIYLPFSFIPVYLQGTTATFHDAENGKFFTETLPRQTSEWNRFDRTVMVKILANGSMDVQESLLYRGPYEAGIRELKSIKEKEKQNYAERRVKGVHPRAVLQSFGLSDMNDLNGPAVLTLKYTIPEAAQMASDKIMTFTNYWVNYDSGSASLATRTYPMQYWGTEENQQTIVFELPENFDWVTWNKQYQHVSPDLTFMSNINQNDRQLIYADRFIARADEFLSDAAYQNYRQCILTMSELANQWIILEKSDKPKLEAARADGATATADISKGSD
ncbi:MAG TPA: DUF3857 domain-containing protein [Candidatus Rifleibacterium sp.]|nr:DUF3857 domain-containing protein [Candidatus Rifleibacterium sp.]HPT45210.1 DUF3857 domain-containing protein [Candidatus Rifleibacterium sp.]